MANNFFNFFKASDDLNDDDSRLATLNIEDVIPNRYQPRKVFSDDKIKELADNIDRNGLLQPIVVREFEPHHYEIIAGERRYRAVKSLNRKTIQAIVRKVNNKASAIQALNENIQRENLSSIEEAYAYRNLLNLTNGTQGDLAKQLGKSQSAVANKLRLLNLVDKVQDALSDGTITERHGRELLRLDPLDQLNVLAEIEDKSLNIKQTKDVIDRLLKNRSKITNRKAKPKAKIMNHFDNMKLASQTIKKSLSMIEESGITVTHEERKVNDNETEIIIHMTKSNDPNKNK